VNGYISIDFETRSVCNLIAEGAYRYATHPSTEVICCAFRALDGDIYTWLPPWVHKILPDHENPDLDALLFGNKYVAWNSQFDRLQWQNVCTRLYGWPDTEIEDWLCTASLARTNGLPGKLEHAGRALNLPIQKLSGLGRGLIQRLCVPDRKTGEFSESPRDLRAMCMQYCPQDVEVEHSIASMLRRFLPHEITEFHVSEIINDTGIGVDTEFCSEAIHYTQTEMTVLERRLSELTEGTVERPRQYQRIKDWLYTRLSPDAQSLLHRYEDGKLKLTLDRNARLSLLAFADENPDQIDDASREVIEITDLAGRSTTAKYKTLLSRSINGFYQGAYLFSGAASTGRFSSTGVQIHNLKRDCVDDFDAAQRQLKNLTDSAAIHTLSEMIRPTFWAAPDCELYWSDWSNIEGRALPWLASTSGGRDKLALFEHCDEHPEEPDIYERTAKLLGKNTSRQVGKVAELSLGYGGGIGAGKAMARAYGVTLSDAQMTRIRDRWREANRWAKHYWHDCKTAAWSAMKNPEKFYRAGRVRYLYMPEHFNGLGVLWCQLPSQRMLAYVEPRIERVPVPWDKKKTMLELTAQKANFLPGSTDASWPRYKLWYGVLVENITQAVCADILRAALVRINTAGMTIVGHTHDEIIVESSDPNTADELPRLMEERPKWCPDLALRADIHHGVRYTK
jgi:DNA polymerase